MQAALRKSDALEEMQLQEICHAQAHKGAGLDDQGLTKLAE
ncbi:hypothetical protein [Streptomonospora alba]|nr:hypothetical protein [Streptomonospora alba]